MAPSWYNHFFGPAQNISFSHFQCLEQKKRKRQILIHSYTFRSRRFDFWWGKQQGKLKNFWDTSYQVLLIIILCYLPRKGRWQWIISLLYPLISQCSWPVATISGCCQHPSMSSFYCSFSFNLSHKYSFHYIFMPLDILTIGVLCFSLILFSVSLDKGKSINENITLFQRPILFAVSKVLIPCSNIKCCMWPQWFI